MSFATIDVNLFSHNESTRNATNILANGFIVTRFLFTELITREQQNSQTTFVVLFIKFFQLSVIGSSKAALGSNIDDQDDFTLKYSQIQVIATDILDGKVIESSFGS